MASKRKKGSKWEFVVKRAGVLEKPLYLMFDSEAVGDTYCRKLEALLDRGIVPTEYQPNNGAKTLGALVAEYLRDAHPSKNDREVLRVLMPTLGQAPCAGIDAAWVDALVQQMKREHQYTPSTIRAKIGALARATDWGARKKLILIPDQPFRTLPEGYATYTELDGKLAGGARKDSERDRRLEPGEEARILAVLAGGTLPRKARPYEIPHKEDVEMLFKLALETAMRLSEMYTLTADRIDLRGRTVFLDKTKNGDSRAVPLSSVAVRLLLGYQDRTGLLFPWFEIHRHNRKLTSNYLSKLFSEVFEAAGCGDLRFHDLRHEAVSRLFERTNLMAEEIMKVVGHKTHRMVMRYLKLRPSDLADRLW
jgi:integrase